MEFKAKDRRLEGETLLRQCQLAELYILDVFVEICEKYNLRYFLDAGTLLGAARHSGFIPWDDDIDVGMPRVDLKRFLEVAPKELPETLFVTPNEEYEDVGSIYKIRERTSFFCDINTNSQEPCGLYIDIFPYEEVPYLPDKIGRPLTQLCKEAFLNAWIHRRLHHRTIAGIFDSFVKALIWTSLYYLTRSAFALLKACCHKVWRYTPGVFYNTYHSGFEAEDVYPLGFVKFEGKQYRAPRNVDNHLTHFYGNWRELPPPEKRQWHASIICTTQAPDAPWACKYKA